KFQVFQNELLILAQKMARSSKPEDREKAANLKKAIALASEKGTDIKFDKLIASLRAAGFTVSDIKSALKENESLEQDIQAILDLLLSDNRDDAIKKEKARLEALIKMLEKAIRDQKVARSIVESGKADKQGQLKP